MADEVDRELLIILEGIITKRATHHHHLSTTAESTVKPGLTTLGTFSLFTPVASTLCNPA